MSTLPLVGTAFGGFGDHAPLDLPDAPGLLRFATETRKGGTFRDALDRFSDDLARVGNCSNPVRLKGWTMHIDTAADRMVSHLGDEHAPAEVMVACGNRREDKCPACARVYARDTFELIRSGVAGGKTVPSTVAANPLLFVTLTAPSFGHVHGQRNGRPCRAFGSRDSKARCSHGRPVACWETHSDDDPDLGAPICGDCYDWHTAVIWQHRAPELWRRFTINLRRGLAAALDVGERPSKTRLGLADVAGVQYAKVAEFQTRGVVHFHALMRLDGPHGPGSPAPMGGDRLAVIVRKAVRDVTVMTPPVDGADVPRELHFGVQLDVRTVRTGLPDTTEHGDPRDTDDLSAGQVAGYLAKYATKGTAADHTYNRAHLVHMERVAEDLADRWEHEGRALLGLDEGDEGPYDRLRKWVHMLGFRGHFSTKSRRFSITLGRLRRARARFARLKAAADRAGEQLDTRDLEARLLADDEGTTLVVGAWDYTGQGWRTHGERALAEAAAARAREYAKWKGAQRITRDTPSADQGQRH